MKNILLLKDDNLQDFPWNEIIEHSWCLVYISIYIIIQAIFFIYYKILYDAFSKSNYSNDVLLMFEPSHILIQFFWNLNISIITMLSLSKVKFSLCKFEL
jgi:fucose 4-O-acetylase-like acetyltransferase